MAERGVRSIAYLKAMLIDNGQSQGRVDGGMVTIPSRGVRRMLAIQERFDGWKRSRR